MINEEMMARLEKQGAAKRPADPVAVAVTEAADKICKATCEAHSAAADSQQAVAGGLNALAEKLGCKPTYKFEIKRTKDGLIESVIARPLEHDDAVAV